jgi:chitosanase
MLRQATTCLVGLTLSMGCIGTHQTAHASPRPGFTPDQRRTADEIISIFENDTPTLRYDYVENLRDGRGYTAGRAGFCSGNQDMSDVIDLYSKSRPKNAMTKFVTLLHAKAKTGDDSVADLDDLGFKNTWQVAAKDPLFRKAQDQVVDRQVYEPALKHWRHEGCTTPLALLAIYDAEVQQGDATDTDGTPALIAQTDRAVGGNPAGGVPESKWLANFLNNRHKLLQNPHDSSTRAEWGKSASRVTALESLLQQQNFALKLPLEFKAFDEKWRVTPEGAHRLPDNG